MYGAGCLHFLIWIDLIPNLLVQFISHNTDKSSSISQSDRPVSSTIADRLINQLLLPEKAKEQDRIRTYFTKIEAAFPSQLQILFQNFKFSRDANWIQTQFTQNCELEELKRTCSVYLANFRKILIIIDTFIHLNK